MFVSQVLIRPYKVEAMNRLESMSLLALALTFYLLTYFVVNDFSQPGLHMALAVLITFINASVVLYMLYCLAIEVSAILYSFALVRCMSKTHATGGYQNCAILHMMA